MTDAATPKKWLRASQAAAIWECSRRSVATWADRHGVKSRTTSGGERQYLAQHVELFAQHLDADDIDGRIVNDEWVPNTEAP